VILTAGPSIRDEIVFGPNGTKFEVDLLKNGVGVPEGKLRVHRKAWNRRVLQECIHEPISHFTKRSKLSYFRDLPIHWLSVVHPTIPIFIIPSSFISSFIIGILPISYTSITASLSNLLDFNN